MRRAASLLAALALAGCERATLPESAGFGANPKLPAPRHRVIPTLELAKARGCPEGAVPKGAPGISVSAFATRLEHPRWLYVLPNGDVLVAETNGPPRPENDDGIEGWIVRQVMKKVGAGAPSANRITLLCDADGDGRAEMRTIFLEGLNSPFGMVLVGNDFYVANTDAVLRFAYTLGDTRISGAGRKVLDLPAGPLNHHWTKNLLAALDGSKLYVTVGSNSNVAENGIVKEEGRAAIWDLDLRTGMHRIFASGLRNPNGLAWEPQRGALWTTVNERDGLGSDLVPDYMTSLKEGGFYGWPYSYFGQHADPRVRDQRPDLVARAIAPDYALGAHTASLGLAFADGSGLPQPFTSGAFVGQHGSWNRRPPSGYKVVFVPFADGQPSGPPVDVLTGFLSQEGESFGRPVGVVIDKKGALLVADDVGNAVWRATGSVP
jgi:glucose/arabinose dehydrogenase